MKTITIIGGGNSAHVLIPLLSKSGLRVNLLTRRPKKWSNKITLEYTLPSGELKDTYIGTIDKISSNPKDVICDADIIMLCMPVHTYRDALNQIAPYISSKKEVYIGTVFGQAGFNWMVYEIIKKFKLKKIVTFALGLIPWICRTKEYGKSGIVYGAKPINVVAILPQNKFQELNDILLDNIVFKWFGHGKFVQADNFISLTLSLDNQIIHTARLYGLYLESGGFWDKLEEVPYFYRDFSLKSADILKGLDDDYSLIRNRIKRLFPTVKFTYMLDYLKLDNTTNLINNKTILETFQNSKTLGAIKTPVIEKEGKWVIDNNHRFFRDDIYYGLLIAKWIAEKINIEVANIDALLLWAQNILGDKIIENNRLIIHKQLEENPFKYGVPEVYNLNEIKDIIS